MKITIYELLGLIKEGKAPKKIKVTGTIYYFNENYEMYLTKKENENYEVALGGMDKDINLIANAFNEVVEIIEEEKEIKVINKRYDDELEEYVAETYVNDTYYKEVFNSRYDEMIINKINQLIDVINDMRDKEC